VRHVGRDTLWRAIAVGLALLAALVAVAYAKDTFKAGTYSGTVAPQNYGVTAFPMSLKVVAKKRKGRRTTQITGLTIGPIQMVCSDNATQEDESVTLSALSGFPAIKSTGFLNATFLYEGSHWKRVALSTVQTADPEVQLEMVNDGKHMNSNGGAEPGMDIVVQADVVGSTATVAQGGTSTCNINNSDPTLTLQH
jgi:hypothetical protein